MTYSFKEKATFAAIFVAWILLFFLTRQIDGVWTPPSWGSTLAFSAILTGVIFGMYRKLKIERHERRKKELIYATYKKNEDGNTPELVAKTNETLFEKFDDGLTSLLQLIVGIIMSVPFVYGIGRLLWGSVNWLKDGYWTSYTTCGLFGYFCTNNSKWNGINTIFTHIGQTDPFVFLLICIPIGFIMNAIINIESSRS
jgi:hypothetical protein